jgi:hypothetical protein
MSKGLVGKYEKAGIKKKKKKNKKKIKSQNYITLGFGGRGERLFKLVS